MYFAPLFSFLLGLAISIAPAHLISQSIQAQLEFIAIDNVYPYYEHLHVDQHGNYLVGVQVHRTDGEGLTLGDTLVPAFNHYPDDFRLGLSDFFLTKLSTDFSFVNAFVMDNAETIRDIYIGEEYTLISMSLLDTQVEKDSFPILLNGQVELSRPGNRGNGSLIVLDSELQLLDAFFPSDGELGQVAVDGHVAYLELRIPSNEPFIIVGGSDTVYNHTFLSPTDYGRQTVVICRYNLLTDSIEWFRRIGNVGFEELIEMDVDEDHNLVMLGATSSIYFSFNDIDTVMNYVDHNPFIAKYSPDGEFLLGILNSSFVNDNAQDLVMDNSGNYYIISTYYGNDYIIADTVLLNPKLDNGYPIRGIVVKYNKAGEFQWASQIEGLFYLAQFNGLTFSEDGNVIVSGQFIDGEVYMDSDTFMHSIGGGIEYGFLQILDASNGKLLDYVMTGGEWHRLFYELKISANDNLIMFMRYHGTDTIFNQVFNTPPYVHSGYLLRLDLEQLVSSIQTFQTSGDLTLWPNPTSAFTGFNLQSHRLNEKVRTVDMFSCQGILVHRVHGSAQLQHHIDTNFLIPGLYYVVVQTNAAKYTKTLVIAK